MTATADAPTVTLDGQLASVEFDRFDLTTYDLETGVITPKMLQSGQSNSAPGTAATARGLAPKGLTSMQDQYTVVPAAAPRGRNLVGQRFGKLTILAYAPKRNKRTRIVCQCDCGKIVTVDQSNVLAGHTTACGCANVPATKAANTKHGMNDSTIYRRWHWMIQRCSNPRSEHWSYYGGRGIKVCERWHSFEAFYADMGNPPPGTTLDRIDVNGDYSPENCRWATRTEQARNRRNTTMLTHNGETLPVAEWAERYGLSFYVLYERLKAGWSVERALTEPVRSRS